MTQESQGFVQPDGGARGKTALAWCGGIFFIALAALAVWASYAVFEPVRFSTPRVVQIPAGLSVSQASARLSEMGIIRNSVLFRATVTMVYPGRTIKAGEYRIFDSMNSVDAAAFFVNGAPRKELTVRTIEGWNSADIAQYLDEGGVVSRADFFAETVKDYSEQFPFLQSSREKGVSLEGYLFPDTYRIFEGSTAADIVVKFLENFSRQYSADMQEQTRAQSRSINDVVTMASILEREVKNMQDKRMAADIFYRRIAAGIPLQADSTINYITGRSDPGARLVDLAAPSPYNTYKHKGLPPGPISNPGRDALNAALTPTANPYWFFLTTPDGTVIYSKTFEEHVRNKIKYLSKKK
ncbi:endolytic transglycosylase MltG [Candidatus Uhrbacteria bacterium]|nr:endolytic transglycosylase MltG [Candidatus Uhrbacteria bacterium]